MTTITPAVTARPSEPATKAAGPDPTSGRVHVLGKPVHPGILAASALGGTAVGAGAGLLGMRMFGNVAGTPLQRVAFAVGGGIVGGLIGAGLSSFSDGPRVGNSNGKRSVFVKTGEELYNTTCTETIRVNVGDTDGDGFSNYRTHTRTYPCVKVRDVGYTEWRPATGELNLGRHKGDRGGYESLEAARADVTGDVLYVERDGRFHAYGVDTDGPQRKTSITITSPGVYR